MKHLRTIAILVTLGLSLGACASTQTAYGVGDGDSVLAFAVDAHSKSSIHWALMELEPVEAGGTMVRVSLHAWKDHEALSGVPAGEYRVSSLRLGWADGSLGRELAVPAETVVVAPGAIAVAPFAASFTASGTVEWNPVSEDRRLAVENTVAEEIESRFQLIAQR